MNKSDFVRLISSEIEKFKEDLRLKAESLSGLGPDDQVYQLRLKKIDGDFVVASIASPLVYEIKQGAPLELLCGLPDGQYMILSSVHSIANCDLSFRLGQDVHRLQRRENFRTIVPPGSHVHFQLNSLNRTVLNSLKLTLLDLSAGGIRVQWPGSGVEAPKPGDQLSGVLHLPAGRHPEVFGIVRTVNAIADATPPAPYLNVGVQLQNMSIRDEQMLLFACMQIHRESRR